jgi:hypothetical protein
MSEEVVKEPTEEKFSEEVVQQPTEEKVGYGLPPIHTRWKKGESGHRRGRPRRKQPPTERAKQMILDEAYRMVTVREGDKVIKMPALQAVMRSQIKLAVKGSRPAQRDVLNSVKAIEAENEAWDLDFLKEVIDYRHTAEVLHYERKRKGLPERQPGMPHPDDLIFDMDTGTAFLTLEGCKPRPLLINFKPPR